MEYVFIYSIALILVLITEISNSKIEIPGRRFNLKRIIAFIFLMGFTLVIYYFSRDVYLLMPIAFMASVISFFKIGIRKDGIQGYSRVFLKAKNISKAILKYDNKNIYLVALGKKGSDATLEFSIKYKEEVINWFKKHNIALDIR
ncbi:hypothetical protein [Miniphocaeibacter halophilus]|uniref:Uncharacterized protein n=1 Tax=Miniphocaeibacter halophilus TaxID=2931922 RepID=A0AC61MZQ3_9FIRM|nr:hypothetical protein [Miniphocaeibacter halophilus]QQK08641.1 hypothetical protein JFY71_03620 [Miniphocaeibacter halophilus]